MNRTFKQKIAMELLQLENIILGFSEGSIQSVYDEILSMAEEMDLKQEIVGDLVHEIDGKFEATYLEDQYQKIKNLEDEVDSYKSLVHSMIDEINRLRMGILSKDVNHYKEIEQIIKKKYNIIDEEV